MAGIKTTYEAQTPDGWTVILEHTPTHSVTPWDYHGMRWYQRIKTLLDSAGIESKLLLTRFSIVHPRGSGPGGRVRFGDDMVPSLHRVAVPTADADKARATVQEKS